MIIFSLVAMTGLEKCCITSAYLQWQCHSGERPVALGPLVSMLTLNSKYIFWNLLWLSYKMPQLCLHCIIIWSATHVTISPDLSYMWKLQAEIWMIATTFFNWKRRGCFFMLEKRTFSGKSWPSAGRLHQINAQAITPSEFYLFIIEKAVLLLIGWRRS